KGMRGARGTSLRNGGVESVGDLLLHTPRRYIDRSTTTKIADAAVGPEVTIVGKVTGTRTRRPRRNLTIVDATVMDESGIVTATWFNQGFRARQLTEGAEVALSGKLERFKGRLQMKSPAADVLSSPSEALITGRVVPVHPSVGEVGPGHLRRAVHNALARSRPVADPLPEPIRERHDLATRDAALGDIHFPETMGDAQVARRRLVFDEFFRIEVALAMAKHRKGIEAVGVAHTTEPDVGERFLAGLPYALTGAQERAISAIRADMAEPHPMQRLLQGEVGSGKTVVAVAALLTAVDHGGQAAVMAPTEVLATQHYLGITELLDDADLAPPLVGEGAALGMDSLFDGESGGVTVALLTGSQAKCNAAPGATRADLLTWIADGTIDLVIGTHALIQEGVEFQGLTAAVVDEQHRFGVHQRVSLKEKAGDVEPDLLIMTATPIPRTLSMTLYGDLDVTVLDELPPGRSPIETIAISRAEEDTAWARVRQAVAEGRQAFVVCPLVEESDKVEATSAVDEHARLQALMPDLRFGLIHGQLRPDDKADAMHALREGGVDVLVATTVIEVGIDVPNATVMVIEDADRFGLSQLHQLRGRVGRGAHAGTCVLLTDPTTEEGTTRIEAMVRTNDGFELAEVDLSIRGQGTVFDARQSGVGDLRLGDILRDTAELVAARDEAFALVADDPHLEAHADIRDEVQLLLGEEVEWLFKS
ncbi:MAG: ATP-dependent DNA helicase RecG, partial [Acidimicrobiia bacterium]|nr:ATP-dependent DNA helicase RecG [Acidimicrobiia bacterium]